MRRRWLLGFSLMLAGCSVFESSEPCAIEGRLLEYPSGAPLSKGLVKVAGEERTIHVDEQGRFRVDGLGASSSVQFWAPGYPVVSHQYALMPGETRTSDVSLPAKGATLPSRLVLFERGGRIWGADALGANERCLTGDLEGVQVSPTWLQGSDQFAFILRQPGRTQVWARHADGRPARFMAEIPDTAADLRWNPLGDQMAFTVSTFNPSWGMASAIRRLDLNTGAQAEFIFGAAEANLAWSKDGQAVAWAHRVSPRPWQIWVGGPRGEHPRVLAARGSCLEPSWSPTGSQLVYVSNATGHWEIYLAGVTTGFSEQLTKFPEEAWCRRPVWSSETDEILYESNYHPGLGRILPTPAVFALRLSTRTSRAIVADAHDATW